MVEIVEHHGKVGNSAHMPNLTLSNYSVQNKSVGANLPQAMEIVYTIGHIGMNICQPLMQPCHPYGWQYGVVPNGSGSEVFTQL